MKTKTIFAITIITLVGIMISMANRIHAKTNNKKMIAAITRYDVKKDSGKQFQKALHTYVTNVLTDENNIMAEAYSEENNPEVLWVIERWNNKAGFDNAHKSSSFVAILSLSQNTLIKPANTILVNDLEPLTKTQWRKTAEASDTTLVIMLFVDAKPGTENTFKKVYHKAMPQFRSEPGVINYQLSQFDNDSTQFVTYEKFRNDDAFQYHLKFPPIQPVIDYLNTRIKKQPFQTGLHRLIAIKP